jgi:DNA-binding transcriptional MerR regulator
MSDLYTLESMSKRLGGIPISTLKHRIQQLGIPASARGSRNKLLFDERAVALLEASDQLMREGHGINTTRRLLKLESASESVPVLKAEQTPQMSVARAIDLDGTGIEQALTQLADALGKALAQLESKDRQIDQLQEDLRRTSEASATFQQKTFYLQGELQRLQGDLKDARRPPSKDQQGAWQRLWKREPNQP